MRARQAQVCVIGSGAGGSMVALRLAERGASVLVLEKGPRLRREDFLADELSVLRRLGRPTLPGEPHSVRRRADDEAVLSDAGWTAACVGGATVVYGGVSLRLRPDDFRLESKLGSIPGADLADWPIAYEELEPYYTEAEEILGVSGDLSSNPFEPPRSRSLPLGPVADKEVGPRLDAGAARLGLHPYRVPLAVLSRPRGGRPACNGCGFCARSGCPIGAKSSALEAVWPRALATGRCEILAETMVFEIGVDGSGRARSVRYLDRAGDAHQIEAEVVVLACGSIETARLLLMSRSPGFRDGLANDTGLVGKYVTFHHVSEVGGFFEVPVHGHRGAPTTRAFDDHYLLPRGAGAPLGGVILLGDGMGPIEFAIERTTWGLDHVRQMASYAHHARLFTIGQDLPRRTNDVTLDPAAKDRFGLPIARITHENHPLDGVAASWMAARARSLLEASGARGCYALVPDNTTGDAHQHGTCRFGADRRRAVLDADCAAFDVPNLFVADGSPFPTPGGVNPALTIQANALRVADRIAQRGLRCEL